MGDRKETAGKHNEVRRDQRHFPTAIRLLVKVLLEH
jgi:hypothetical protein